MTVKLTGNFLATARCLIYQDGNAITWSFNPNTNQLTAAYTGAGSAGSHNPTATIGLTAVNGTAATWMTSDSAPALSQAIVPTWSGLHTFGAGLTISAGTFTLSGHTLALSNNATVGGTNTGDQTLPVGANPSTSVGLTAVNGSAATWMRSDGAPALDVSIVPTWTGTHTFNPGSGVAAAFKQTVTFTGNQGLAASYGSTIALAAGFAAPQSRLYIGDGSGWFFAVAKRTGSADTVLFTFADSGVMTIAGASVGTAYLGINLSATTGTQTATFAANNKPGSGTTGPDKWLPIVLDGTTHYIPCFL